MAKSKHALALIYEPEVNTDKHDEIILWTLDNLNKILPSFNEFNFVSYELEYALREKLFDRGHWYHSNNILGYVDILAKYKWVDDNFDTKVFQGIILEIKTKINLGALLRQIKHYQAHLDCNQLAAPIIISTDIRHKEILEKQGLRFIEAFKELN